MNNFLKWIFLFLGILLCVIPVILYFSQFGLTKEHIPIYALSHDMALWGQFGDFIGGTTGTLISAAAFIAVYFTLLQQGKALQKQEDELSEMRLQSKISRLENLLFQTTHHFDNQLDNVYKFTFKNPYTGEETTENEKLRIHLIGISFLEGRDVNTHIFPMLRDDYHRVCIALALKEQLSLALTELMLTSDTICNLWLAINKLSDNDLTTKHHKYKYLLVFSEMYNGMLITPLVADCFDFDKIEDLVGSGADYSEILKIL
ncbi:hypothetical protein LZT28_21290 [Aeromonas media]|uniref:Phage abortive infection protein n=1 Tax=Aeromonas media TaxID=651 RepID=A0AAW5RPM2_AERME|nr:hypothetical protein [Aeromonas media]MCV3290726.1 hypothetical protein [Aeromonas media]